MSNDTKKILGRRAFLAGTAATLATPALAQNYDIPIREHLFDNGMRLLFTLVLKPEVSERLD